VVGDLVSFFIVFDPDIPNSRIMAPVLLALSALLSLAAAHAGHHHKDQRVFSPAELQELENKWGTDWGFSGISTFAHLPHVKCLTQPETAYDIGIIGAPFDTAVSYRPGKI